MTGGNMTGETPQSKALAEAKPDSLAELWSRDPEGYTRQDRDRTVAALREQRKRFEAAEAAEKPRATKAQRVKDLLATTASAEDLGL